MFGPYEIGTHYKIHKKTAFNSSECAKACWADEACEAFESLSGAFLTSWYGSNLPYQCAFWMQGACNIETVGSKAPGFVSGHPGVVFCDKNSSREPVASNGHMFVLKSVMYSVVLMVSINLW